MSRLIRTLSVLLVIVLVISVTGCASIPASPAPESVGKTEQAPAQKPAEPQVAQSKLTFGMAVHSNPAEDLFWGVVEKGAKDAAATYGITLKSGGSGQPKEQAQLIEDYVAAKVDGIFVSLANPDALKDAIKKATDAGIPVITINSGAGVYKQFGALTHVGQTERVAGRAPVNSSPRRAQRRCSA